MDGYVEVLLGKVKYQYYSYWKAFETKNYLIFPNNNINWYFPSQLSYRILGVYQNLGSINQGLPAILNETVTSLPLYNLLQSDLSIYKLLITLIGISINPRKSSILPSWTQVDFLADCITSLKNLVTKTNQERKNTLHISAQNNFSSFKIQVWQGIYYNRAYRESIVKFFSHLYNNVGLSRWTPLSSRLIDIRPSLLRW